MTYDLNVETTECVLLIPQTEPSTKSHLVTRLDHFGKQNQPTAKAGPSALLVTHRHTSWQSDTRIGRPSRAALHVIIGRQRFNDHGQETCDVLVWLLPGRRRL